MDEKFGPLNVREELMPESRPVCRAFDQSRDISQYKSSGAIEINNAQDRIQCGEMIIGDSGFCIADHRKQCGFSDIRKADKADVSDHFQLKDQLKGP